MSYCVAIKVNQGLVFASDSRTNAGVDHIATYGKMHTFDLKKDRFVFLLSAGNLATTQAVVNLIERDLTSSEAKVNLNTVGYLFDAAHYVGQISVGVQEEHRDFVRKSGINVEASFILGGRIQGKPHDIFLIYPQGNYINASPETPFLQIGETKYGKPILDRVISSDTSLEDAARCALVSIDSTMRSNIAVGPPIELGIFRKEELAMAHRLSLNPSSPLYATIQKGWSEGLRRAFRRLPRFDWETGAD